MCNNSSSITQICRICHEDEKEGGKLISPCNCSGTLGMIHQSCLELWLSTSDSNLCEICKSLFVVQKCNKPFKEYLRSNFKLCGPRNIIADLISLLLCTPLVLWFIYIRIIELKSSNYPAVFKHPALVYLSYVLIVIYFLWLITGISYHYIYWKRWCKDNQVTKLVVKKINNRSIKEENSPNRLIKDTLIP